MKKWTRYLFATLMALMCLSTMLMPICAAGTSSVALPVTVKITGSKPSQNHDFQIVMKPVDAANPMPEGSQDGKYVLTVSAGKDNPVTATFPAITFNRVGIYDYTVSQIAGTNKRFTYDDQEYFVRIYITNNKDMTALEYTVVVYTGNPDQEDKKAEKVDEVVFTNKYTKPTTTDSPQTGDESQPLLYAGLIAASLAVLVALMVTRKPKYSDEE